MFSIVVRHTHRKQPEVLALVLEYIIEGVLQGSEKARTAVIWNGWERIVISRNDSTLVNSMCLGQCLESNSC